MKRHTKSLILLLSLTLLSLSTTNLTHAVTFSQDIGVSFTFNPSIQINLSSSNLVIPNLAPGTSDDSNIITVSVLTNSVAGYTLNATVGNSTTYTTRDLKHNDSNISNKFTSVAFGSSIASNTNLENNTWAYSYLDESLNNGTNTTWTNYDGLPLYDDETNIATLKSSNDPVSSASGDSIKFKIAAKASGDQLSGTYNNVINFIAVANPVPTPAPISCPSGYICYSDSGANSPTTMSNQEINAQWQRAELWGSNFQLSGYGFAGWSDKYDWVLNENDVDGNGTGVNAGYHIYGPNTILTFPNGEYSGSNPGLALYAVWVPSAGDLQSFTCPNNSTMPIGTMTALRDQRDNNVYAVAKLKDGKCWMVENLRLDNTAAHNSDGTLAQGYNSSFIGLADPETGNISGTTANSLYSTDGSTAFTISGNGVAYRFPRYDNRHTASPVANMTSWSNTTSRIYSVGNYYTWAAAIADTSYYNTLNQSITTTSICPYGWHLPKGGNSDNAANSELWSLGVNIMGFAPANNSYYQDSETNANNKTAVAAFRDYPNNFMVSGSHRQMIVPEVGSSGYFWSSTGNNSMTSLMLSISSYAYPGTYSATKDEAATIRCVR